MPYSVSQMFCLIVFATVLLLHLDAFHNQGGNSGIYDGKS